MSASPASKPLSLQRPGSTTSWYKRVRIGTGLFPRAQLPPQIRRQAGLAPDGAAPPARVERFHAARGGLQHRVPDGVQVFEQHPQLDDDVALFAFIERVAEVAIYRPGVHSGIDPQERQADARQVAGRERPEAAVRVAVLG